MNVTRVLAIAALGMISAGSASAQTDGPPTWYNLNDPHDGSSVELMGLDTIAGPPTDTSLVVVNLFRGAQKFGNIETWHIDCVHGRMHISDIMMFNPSGSGSKKAMKGEVISTHASATSRTLSGLACRGNGQLEKSRVDHRELPDITHSFWAGAE